MTTMCMRAFVIKRVDIFLVASTARISIYRAFRSAQRIYAPKYHIEASGHM